MTTQSFYSQFPEIVSKLTSFYGWDDPSQQCQWMVQTLTNKQRDSWSTFRYLVEECLLQTNDRELDYLWFKALEQPQLNSQAA